MTDKIKAKRSQKKGAKEILRLGQKALDYRRDILSTDQVTRLESATAELKNVLIQAIALKPEKHEFKEKPEQVVRLMSMTGG